MFSKIWVHTTHTVLFYFPKRQKYVQSFLHFWIYCRNTNIYYYVTRATTIDRDTVRFWSKFLLKTSISKYFYYNNKKNNFAHTIVPIGEHLTLLLPISNANGTTRASSWSAFQMMHDLLLVLQQQIPPHTNSIHHTIFSSPSYLTPATIENHDKTKLKETHTHTLQWIRRYTVGVLLCVCVCVCMRVWVSFN